MNIYIVSRQDDYGYDEFVEMTVVAKSINEARYMSPEDFIWDKEKRVWFRFDENGNHYEPIFAAWSWTRNPHTLNVIRIGKALKKYKKPEVLSTSFNAG
jgi:hypothetical protein